MHMGYALEIKENFGVIVPVPADECLMGLPVGECDLYRWNPVLERGNVRCERCDKRCKDISSSKGKEIRSDSLGEMFKGVDRE